VTANDLHLELILRTATRAIPAPAGILLLVDHPRRRLNVEVVVGDSLQDFSNTPLLLDEGIAGMVALSGQPIAVACTRGDYAHANDLTERIGYAPQTILAVPVTAANGRVIGVLELFDRQGPPTFGMDDMTLLGMFAQHVAFTLDQRRQESAFPAADEKMAALTDQLTAIAGSSDAGFRLCQGVLGAVSTFINGEGVRP
jgi:GAF domain-containing protein